jgi:hypothetical protein
MINWTKETRPHNKNYMSIAVSVLTTSRVARNSGGAARQENRPQSATAYSSVRYGQFKKTQQLMTNNLT